MRAQGSGTCLQPDALLPVPSFFLTSGARQRSMPRRTRAQPLYEPRFDAFFRRRCAMRFNLESPEKTPRTACGTEAAFTHESLERPASDCNSVRKTRWLNSENFGAAPEKSTGRLRLFSLSKKVLTNRKTGCKRLVVCRPLQFLILRTGFSAAKIIPPYPYTPPGTIGSSRRKLWISRALQGFFDSLQGACLEIQSS